MINDEHKTARAALRRAAIADAGLTHDEQLREQARWELARLLVEAGGDFSQVRELALASRASEGRSRASATVEASVSAILA